MTRTERERARFKIRVAARAEKIRVQPAAVRVQRMRRKWASCSTGGWVSFSTRLLRQPKDFQDYVIVHELLHLKVPNHGKLFKSLLSLHLSAKSREVTRGSGRNTSGSGDIRRDEAHLCLMNEETPT